LSTPSDLRTLDALSQQFGLITRRNHDRHQRGVCWQFINDPMGSGIFRTGNNLRLDPGPTQVFTNRASRRFVRVLFCIWRRRQTTWDFAPMVKHARDVYDLFRPQSLNCAQGKIVMLPAAEQVAKTADFAEQVPAIKAEMVNEILTQKKLGI